MFLLFLLFCFFQWELAVNSFLSSFFFSAWKLYHKKGVLWITFSGLHSDHTFIPGELAYSTLCLEHPMQLIFTLEGLLEFSRSRNSPLENVNTLIQRLDGIFLLSLHIDSDFCYHWNHSALLWRNYMKITLWKIDHMSIEGYHLKAFLTFFFSIWFTCSLPPWRDSAPDQSDQIVTISHDTCWLRDRCGTQLRPVKWASVDLEKDSF